MELKLNSGDVITIPYDCKAVIKDKVITVEKAVQEFKDGDFCVSKNYEYKWVYIYKLRRISQSSFCHAAMAVRNKIVEYNTLHATLDGKTRLATEEEKQLLLDAIHADGKDWDSEKKQIVNYKWKPKIGETYYFISWGFDVLDNPWSYDYWEKLAYNKGNCFKTKEEAQKYADKFIEILKDRKL